MNSVGFFTHNTKDVLRFCYCLCGKYIKPYIQPLHCIQRHSEVPA